MLFSRQYSVQLLPALQRFMGSLIQEAAPLVCNFCLSGNNVQFVLSLVLCQKGDASRVICQASGLLARCWAVS